MKSQEWTKSGWRSFTISQQPVWPNISELNDTIKELTTLPALVFAGETRALRSELAKVSKGEAFLLQCGDCSEEFSGCNGTRIHNHLRVILQMAIILTYVGEKRIVKVGRIAGQYAKPRSSDYEVIDGVQIPTYRGDIINSSDPTIEARTPNPHRILEGYFRAAATLNLIRAFTNGGYASLDKVQDWEMHYFAKNPAMRKYEELVNDINKAISFTKAKGLDISIPQLHEDTLYTSHEGLLLEYEEAMTRVDTTTGDWYDTSAHMLWIGDRTRQPEGAHVEFMRGIGNPIGIKLGHNYNIEELKVIINKLNPDNIQGRLTFITRFGAKNIEKQLPQLIKEIKKEGFQIVWCCDPMHGNTVILNSHKTRRFEDILSEIKLFWKIHKLEGTIPGGVHLELTGEDVTECVGGLSGLSDSDLYRNYTSSVDPRLNAGQAAELAFEIAGIIK
jgi:3-deoxy-7-phosphoheptulonate synthase